MSNWEVRVANEHPEAYAADPTKPALHDITVISDKGKFDKVNWLAGAVRVNEDYVRNFEDLADKLEKRVNKKPVIIGLQLIGHGNKSGQWVGVDWLSNGTIENYNDSLARIKNLMHADAVVTLGGCHTGQAEELMKKLSTKLGGVTVQGGTTYQRPLFPGIEGGVRKCVLQTCEYSGRGFMDWLDEKILD